MGEWEPVQPLSEGKHDCSTPRSAAPRSWWPLLSSRAVVTTRQTTSTPSATSGSGEDTIEDPGLVVDVDGDRGSSCAVPERDRRPSSWRVATGTPAPPTHSPRSGWPRRPGRACMTGRISARATRPKGLFSWTTTSRISRRCSRPRRSSLRTCSSAPQAADSSWPGTRSSTPTKWRGWSSSRFRLRSWTRRRRSSASPIQTARRTSSSATTFRSRRTLGPRVRRSAISRSPSSRRTTRSPRSPLPSLKRRRLR